MRTFEGAATISSTAASVSIGWSLALARSLANQGTINNYVGPGGSRDLIDRLLDTTFSNGDKHRQLCFK
jgi:hypothetical protein